MKNMNKFLFFHKAYKKSMISLPKGRNKIIDKFAMRWREKLKHLMQEGFMKL